jgi:hypothetical protein
MPLEAPVTNAAVPASGLVGEVGISLLTLVLVKMTSGMFGEVENWVVRRLGPF